MNDFLESLNGHMNQLLGRASGPLHFRLFVMPIVVSVLALRAHLRDVREGRSTPLWAFIKDPIERPRLFRSGLKDFGRVFVIACVLDTIYQVMVFRAFHPVQMLIVAMACAVVPYFLIRGPVTRLAVLLHRKWTESAAQPKE
jgi:hypothetical protein